MKDGLILNVEISVKKKIKIFLTKKKKEFMKYLLICKLIKLIFVIAK